MLGDRKGFWSVVKRMLIETVTLAPNGQKQEYMHKRMDTMKIHGQVLGRWPPCPGQMHCRGGQKTVLAG